MRTLILLAGLSLVGVTHAQEKHQFGTVNSLDVENGTLTVRQMPKLKEKTFNLLNRELPVTHSLGHKLRLEDIRKNDRVAFELSDGEDIVAIRVDTDCEWGLLEEIHQNPPAISVKFGYAVRKYEITPQVVLEIDNVKATLKQFRKGGYLEAHLSPDHTKLVKVKQGKGIVAWNRYCKNRYGSGLLLDIDKSKKTLRIVDVNERYELEDFAYEGWTRVRLLHSTYQLGDGSLEELKPYLRVHYTHESDLNRIPQLSVEVPMINRRVVAKIDREKMLLTLKMDEEGTFAEFPVNADAVVMQSGQKRTLAAIKEKQIASVGLSLDQKRVLLIILP